MTDAIRLYYIATIAIQRATMTESEIENYWIRYIHGWWNNAVTYNQLKQLEKLKEP
jgi:hypothetical protein